MASEDLEEKIHKIRLQNEEIRRRYEEVEADKKYAAKQNALVQMVPSDDWPERKEPPEFSAPPKNSQKQKLMNKEHNDRLPQHYSSIQDRLGKKDHKFTQGNGPPPDPKYNFLADSEREMRAGDEGKTDEEKNKGRNKTPRSGPRRRGGSGGGSGGGSRDAFFKDNRGPQAFHSKEESLPEYEAWRAERNRIDEARINRQKTAEGNWRREWDSNKMNIEKDSSRKGESNRKDSNMYERRNNHYDSDYSNRGHGGSRTYHGSQKTHGQQDYRRPHHEQSHEYKRQQDNKPPLSPTDDRAVTATDKSIKVTVNPTSQPKGPVMSVKVNSPSIAGTGRVGPRQKSRITYSSQSDVEVTNQDYNNYSRQKSFDEKTASANFSNGSKSAPKSPFMQRKKEGNSKSPYPQKKESRNDESSARSKNSTKSMYSQKVESKDQRNINTSASKSQRNQKRNHKLSGDNLENVIMSNDNALPVEYQPEKLSNNTRDLKLNDSNNIKEISNIVNDQDQGSLDEFKDVDISLMPEKSMNETGDSFGIKEANGKCNENNDSVVDKDSCDSILIESIEVNDQVQKQETAELQKNDLDSEKIETEDEPQTVVELTNDENQNLNLSNITQQTILQDIIEQDSIQLSTNTQQNVLDITDSKVSSKTLEEVAVPEVINNDKEVEQAIPKEEIDITVSEKIIEETKLDINEENLTSAQALHNDDQKNDSKLEEDSKLQKGNICLNDDENKNVEQAVQNDDQKISNQLVEDSKLQVSDNVCTNDETTETVEKIVHNDDQKINTQSEDSKLQELESSSLNENKSIDQEKNVKEVSERNENELTHAENKSIIINESRSPVLIEICRNESMNDSGLEDTSIVNQSIELDDTEINETNSIQNISANDSGIVDDSTEIKTQASTPVSPSIMSVNINDVEKDSSESIKSVLVEPTKEICEKTAENCDISSAASSETSVKDKAETNDNNHEEANETLATLTKDSGNDVMEDGNKIEASKLTDIKKEIVSEKENPEKEESTKVATE